MSPFDDEWLKLFRRRWWELPPPFTVHRPGPGILEIRKSRAQAGMFLVLAGVALGIVVRMLFTMSEERLSELSLDGIKLIITERPWIVALALAAGILVAEMVRLLWILIAGRVLVFDADALTIARNGREVARFGDVECIRRRVVSHAQGSIEYNLDLVMRSGRTLAVAAQAMDHEDIDAAAEGIAELLGLTVQHA
jgi:hypothetical protein